MHALGFLWPALVPVATGIGGALAASRRIKPKLTAAQTKEEAFYNAGFVMAPAIEELKTKHADARACLKREIEEVRDKLIDPKHQRRLENVIRGLRGLPPLSETTS